MALRFLNSADHLWNDGPPTHSATPACKLMFSHVPKHSRLPPLFFLPPVALDTKTMYFSHILIGWKPAELNQPPSDVKRAPTERASGAKGLELSLLPKEILHQLQEFVSAADQRKIAGLLRS